MPESMIRVFTAQQQLRGNRFRGKTTARMSGDMTTSLGNGFTNYLVMKAVCAYHGLSCEGVVEGDDGIFGVATIPKEEWFVPFGFALECTPVESVDRAGFCSAYWSADQSLLIDPVRLFKLGWSCRCPLGMSWEKRKELFVGTMTCLAYEAGSCPLFWACARKFGRGKSRVDNDWWSRYVLDAEGVKYDVNGPWITFERGQLPVSKPSRVARTAFAELFDFPIELQEAVERRILTHGDLNVPRLVDWCSQEHPELLVNAAHYVCMGKQVSGF